MDYRDNLTEQILLATKKIQEEFPELIKYLEEMPGDFEYSTEKSVNQRALKDYLDSLNKLLETHKK